MKPTKSSIKHPYAATEHRVIDSPAYADLTFSARSLLVLITRQLTKDNNGHLQATFSYMERFGFSVNTLSRATHELITHGFIYRTKSGGFHQGAAQFAVTWLSVTNKQGIFLAGFQPCAWRDWQASEKKSRPPKVRAHSIKNGELTPNTVSKIETTPPPKSEHIELCHVGVVNSGVKATGETLRARRTHSQPSANCPIASDDEYVRERDSEQTAGYWDGELGEYVKPPTRTEPKSAKIEQVRAEIAARVIAARKRGDDART
jgi:hypothetical protein